MDGLLCTMYGLRGGITKVRYILRLFYSCSGYRNRSGSAFLIKEDCLRNGNLPPLGSNPIQSNPMPSIYPFIHPLSLAGTQAFRLSLTSYSFPFFSLLLSFSFFPLSVQSSDRRTDSVAYVRTSITLPGSGSRFSVGIRIEIWIGIKSKRNTGTECVDGWLVGCAFWMFIDC